MKNTLFIPLLVLVFSLTTSYSRAQTNLDSLWQVWNDSSQPDTNRCKVINRIIWSSYLFTQPDSAFYFAQQQYDFAQSKGLKKHMAAALNTQGVSFAIRSDYPKAIDLYTKSQKIKEEIGDKKGAAASLNNIGIIYMNQGDYVMALDYYTKSLKIQEELGNKQGISISLNNFGIIYQNQGDYAKAIYYYTKVLKIKEETRDNQGISRSLNNIGNIYYFQLDYDKAIDYFTKSLTIEEEIGNKKGIATALNNLGNIYSDLGDYTRAIDYNTKSLKLGEEIGSKKGIASSLSNLGNIYIHQSKYAKALEHLTKSLEIFKEIGDKQGVSLSLNIIGGVFYEKNDYHKALKHGSRALFIAEEIGNAKQIKETSSLLWKTYRKLNNYQQALSMFELYISTRDTLESEENQKEVIRQEFQYNYEKQFLADSLDFVKEQEIEQVAHHAALEKEAQQRYVLYGGLGFLLLLGATAFRGYQRKKKDNVLITAQKQEVELQKELVEEKNQEITDSITYAKRIQEAILPPMRNVKEWLPNSFILYKPKDIVAGDFYWVDTPSTIKSNELKTLSISTSTKTSFPLELAPTSRWGRTEGGILFAAADCTGHGVPGAMVSVVCHNAMNRSVREFGLTEPGKILDKTRELVVETFEASDEDVKDGMDIALCSLQGNTLKYAGANNPLWIIRNGEIIETKANKQPIGKVDNPAPFTTHTFELQKNDAFYIFSDGYVDQFGGEKGKKFKAKALRELLLSIQEKSMEEQRELLNKAFETWKGDIEQVDDVCFIGVRI